MRLVGATAAGWMADRMGRKTPLMISILWYSICNFIAGFSPTFYVPAGVPRAARHRHGRRMAGRRGAGDGDLADPLARLHERRPAGLVGPRLRCCRRCSTACSTIISAGAACCGSASCRRWSSCGSAIFVKEPEVWAENKRQQAEKKAEVQAPLFNIFKRRHLSNTLTGLPVDGRGVLRLLLDLGAVLDLPAKGAELDAGHGGDVRCSGPTSWSSPASAVWGCGRGQMGQAARRSSSLRSIADLRDAALSVDRPIRSGSCSASSCRACSAARSTARTRATCQRALPDRGARDGLRLRLSPGRDLGRAGGAGASATSPSSRRWASPCR